MADGHMGFGRAVIPSDVLFWLLALASLLAGVLLMIVASAFAFSAVVRAQQRGYRPAGAVVVVVVVVVSAAVAPFVVTAQFVDLFGPSGTVNDPFPLLLMMLCAASAIVGAVAAWLLARALPSQVTRRPGLRPRKHRYEAWSYVMIPLTAVGAVWAWLTDGVEMTLRAVMIGSGLTIGLRRLEGRLGSQLPSVPTGMSNHVLYLRPFGIERRNTFRLPSSRAESTGQGLRRWVALDEFLVRGAGERLGPVIALGNPAEFLPPGGATRVYLSDDTWQEELAGLAAGASQIIMQPGRTAAMRWELRLIATRRLQTKLFIFTAPYHRFALLSGMSVSFMDRLNGWDLPTWAEFAQELAGAGLTVRCPDPGPGSIVGFDRDAASVVLARNLKEPAEYVEVIMKTTG